MKKQCVYLLLIWPTLTLADPQAYFSLNSFSYSEPIPVRQLDQNNYDFDGGEIALTHNWAEIGVTYNNFGVGILGRYDYDLNFSKDTAEFYYLVNNKKPLQQGKKYDLFLEAKHTYSKGVRFSYYFPVIHDTKMNVGLSYLQGIWMTEGKARGRGVALSEKDYDFQFDVDYYYSEDVMFERQTDTPTGQGYSFDISLDWQINRKAGLKLRVIDLFGKIYWKNAPFTTAAASSDVKEYDEDGYLIYKPVLSGFEGNSDFTQELQPQINGLLHYQWKDSLAVLWQIYSFTFADFYQFGLRYSLDSTSRFSALYMIETRAISIGYELKFFNVMITSDTFDLENAHTLGLSLNLSTVF